MSAFCSVLVSHAAKAAHFATRSPRLEKHGSPTNEVRGDMCALNVLALLDDVSAATEPERLAHISLGQENPRMRMNAAPG